MPATTGIDESAAVIHVDPGWDPAAASAGRARGQRTVLEKPNR